MVDVAAERKRAPSFMPIYSPPMPDDYPEYPRLQLLALEREAMGFYVSGHPLDGLDEYIRQNSTHSVANIPMDEWVTVAGVITFIEVKKTKKGDAMAIIQLEDATGSEEIVFFPGSYAKVKRGLTEDAIVFVSGKKDERNFIGNRLEVPKLKG